jgi:hypothetical protein
VAAGDLIGQEVAVDAVEIGPGGEGGEVAGLEFMAASLMPVTVHKRDDPPGWVGVGPEMLSPAGLTIV